VSWKGFGKTRRVRVILVAANKLPVVWKPRQTSYAKFDFKI